MNATASDETATATESTPAITISPAELFRHIGQLVCLSVPLQGLSAYWAYELSSLLGDSSPDWDALGEWTAYGFGLFIVSWSLTPAPRGNLFGFLGKMGLVLAGFTAGYVLLSLLLAICKHGLLVVTPQFIALSACAAVVLGPFMYGSGEKNAANSTGREQSDEHLVAPEARL